MSLKHDVDKLAHRITPAERWASERLVKVFTNQFVIAHPAARPTDLLAAGDAYAAWQAVWYRHHGPQPEPLGLELFCLSMADRGYTVTRRRCADWLSHCHLHIPQLVSELTTGTSGTAELRARLQAAADELDAARAALKVGTK